MNVKLAIGSALAAFGLLAGAVSAAAQPDRSGAGELASLRAATQADHSIATAEQQKYSLLTDVDGIACIDMPRMGAMTGMGAMGVHWANSDLVGDPAIVPDHPEALVYAPQRDGTLHLAAVEYVVIKQAWDATHAHAPRLFGHPFDLTTEPNRFGLPAFYSLHVWAWKHNPAGMFAMWNPDVVC